MLLFILPVLMPKKSAINTVKAIRNHNTMQKIYYEMFFDNLFVLFKKAVCPLKLAASISSLSGHNCSLCLNDVYGKDPSAYLKQRITAANFLTDHSFCPKMLGARLSQLETLSRPLISEMYRALGFIRRNCSFAQSHEEVHINLVLDLLNLYRKNMLHRLMTDGHERSAKIVMAPPLNFYLVHKTHVMYTKTHVSRKAVNRLYKKDVQPNAGSAEAEAKFLKSCVVRHDVAFGASESVCSTGIRFIAPADEQTGDAESVGRALQQMKMRNLVAFLNLDVVYE